jgi:predicted regulator of Ras-like GTPase activity (Roadblock/LC7/MglB family)
LPPPTPHRDTAATSLDEALARLREHEGVEHLILLGRDGLVVRHSGTGPIEEETIAARVPALAAACERLAGPLGHDDFRTAVLEFGQGVAIVVSISPDLLLAVLVEAGAGFAPLLRELRRERSRLAELI